METASWSDFYKIYELERYKYKRTWHLKSGCVRVLAEENVLGMDMERVVKVECKWRLTLTG